MITFKQLLQENFKNQRHLSRSNSKVTRLQSPSNDNQLKKLKREFKLYDWGDKQVYSEAGSFKAPYQAFAKLNQLYKEDPDAYGDLGVIMNIGREVYSITIKSGKYYQSKIGN